MRLVRKCRHRAWCRRGTVALHQPAHARPVPPDRLLRRSLSRTVATGTPPPSTTDGPLSTT